MSLFAEAPGDLVFQANNLPAPRGARQAKLHIITTRLHTLGIFGFLINLTSNSDPRLNC